MNEESSLRKFYGRHHDFVDRYEIYVPNMTTNMFHLSVLSSFMIYHRVCCCWNVATYEWKVHNGKIEIISFSVLIILSEYKCLKRYQPCKWFYFVILSPGLNVYTAHVLMRFCHLNKSLVCLQSERRTSY
jgi:hypothetical protein